MLERVSPCIEPASQLFLRAIDPPIRSSRALGPSFWRNGGHDITVPSWWPLYLENVRRRSQEQDGPRSRPRSGIPHLTGGRAARAAKHDAIPIRPVAAAPSRKYTSNSRLDQEVHDASSPNSTSKNSESAAEDPEFQSTILPFTVHPASTPHNPSDQPEVEIEQGLKSILGGNLGTPQDPEIFNRADVRQAFVRLLKQKTNASTLFHFLARSLPSDPRSKQPEWAHQAFSSIPVSDRTARDYSAAVRVALKMDNLPLAHKINAQATDRGLHHECSAFMLLHFTSHMLWKNAVRVWVTSFTEIYSNPHSSASGLKEELFSQASHYKDLPHAMNELASRLRRRSPLVVRLYGRLLQIGRILLSVLVRSNRLMGQITPKGLLEIFNTYEVLGQLTPDYYISAISTLLESANRPDKSGLATLIYRQLRSKFPEFRPPPSVYGSLISLHAKEAGSLKAFSFYLQEFALMHGVADKLSYQKVLTALAQQGDVVGVYSVFKELCQTHSPPAEIDFYTPLLYVHARLGDVESAQREFQDLKDRGLETTPACWNILLYAHARSSNPETAFDIFRKMRTEGVRPDKYTFGTLMGIVSRAGDINEVLSIIEQAQQYGVKGSYEVMSGLIHSYCLNDQADTAEKLAEATTGANFEGDPVQMWNYILRHYAFRKDSDGCLRIQTRMHALGVKPDDMTYAAMMTALVALGKTKSAAQILRKLSLSQTLVANPFHYSIIIHGFALEEDRDMAYVVYHEMMERFPTLGASPHLAMLHLQNRRSPEAKDSAQFSVDFLAEILQRITATDRATKVPQPGLQRRRAVDATPSIYIEHLVNVLMAKGRVRQADILIQRFESLVRSSFLDLDLKTLDSLELLTSRLRVSTQSHDWEHVEALWTRILERAVQVATPYSDTKNREDREISKLQSATVGVELLESEPGFEFSSMIPDSASRELAGEALLDSLDSKVLSTQRFILETAINNYFRALDLQHRHSSAVTLVRLLEKAGFALTNKNWNFYIQILTRSPDSQHWEEAFRVFEEKMFSNTPPWNLLVRGKYLVPAAPHATSNQDMKVGRRSAGDQTRADFLTPTYFTTVHLATVIKKSGLQTRRGDDSLALRLPKIAPNTYQFIRRMPRRKDRFQGVLLRGAKIRGDIPKRPREFAPADRSGVLGSRSPLDHVPVTELEYIDQVVDRLDKDSVVDVARAERFDGQIDRSLQPMDQEGRLENDLEYQERIHRQERTLLDTVDTIRRDASRPRIMSDDYFGQPVILSDSTVPGNVATPRGNLLFDSFHRVLEDKSEREDVRRRRLQDLVRPGAAGRRATGGNPRNSASEAHGKKALKTYWPIASARTDRFALKSRVHLPERLSQVKSLGLNDPRVKAAWENVPKRKETPVADGEQGTNREE
ncbi:hypothetical protein LTS15_006610 [Exophiala xenobiotica]|nr:hypothetical protein LTS15_006610 [Exophiala xenobiotica]